MQPARVNFPKKASRCNLHEPTFQKKPAHVVGNPFPIGESRASPRLPLSRELLRFIFPTSNDMKHAAGSGLSILQVVFPLVCIRLFVMSWFPYPPQKILNPMMRDDGDVQCILASICQEDGPIDDFIGNLGNLRCQGPWFRPQVSRLIRRPLVAAVSRSEDHDITEEEKKARFKTLATSR
jgi:hypothetical protein